MKTDKRLQKLIDTLVKNSLNVKGEIKNDSVKKFTKTLSKLPRSNAIFALTSYSKKLKKQMDKTTLIIETATPLEPIHVKKIVNAFKVDYPVTQVKTVTNPKLIGGVRLRLGDSVFDDSLNSKIFQIKEAIVS